MKDQIERQKAIEAIVNTVSEIGLHDNSEVARYGATFRQHEIIDIIEGMPSAQPEPQWIPVSERLPENGKQVLVYARSVHYALAKYDEMREADGTYKKQWVTFDAWKPFYAIKEVIAWMPLPEPYRGGDGS